MNDRTPYTYLIGWSNHNMFYYGLRHGVGCHPDELWNTYFTSSKYVKEFVKTHGNPDIIDIRKTFKSKEKACIWEHKVLKRLNAKNRSDFLNQTDNIAISSEASKRGVETMRNMEIHPNKGRKKPHLSEMNRSKTGELNHMYGKKGSLAPRYGIVGVLHPMFGKKNPAASEAAKMRVECPHCKKLGNIANMKRWHFDNCKINKNKKEIQNALVEQNRRD